MQRQTPHNTGVKHMEFTIKGRREKESINEIRSKPKPADVTAKTALMSPSVCTAVQNRRRPPACQSESCHLRPNERSRKSGIDFGTSRPGNPTPRQNRAVSPAANTTISTARTKPYAPAPFGCVRRKRRNNIPNSSGKNARALQFSERATVSADADAFDRPLRFRITRREGKDEHPLPLRFGKLFAGKSPPLPFIRRYTIPVVNAT